MKRVAVILLAALALVTSCSNPNYDPDMCDFYHSLGANYTLSQGYVPADVQEDIDMYCER
jgi:hypothetical protein